MTLDEIKEAINRGHKVYYLSYLYEVIKGGNGEYFVLSKSTNHKIGLVWDDGVTMNGKEEDFHKKE